MAEFNDKKVMVTGGAGFIGFHLSKALTSLTNNLTIYDNLSSGKIENVQDVPAAKFVKGDILDLKTLLTQEKMDVIYHLAAQVVVPYSMENPMEDFDTNAKGTLCVLEKARKDDAKVVFASSAAVYGNPSVFPTPESYGFHPFSCYGLSKVVGEEYCQMYREQYGLDIVITRFANVYGSRCHGVIHDFLDKLVKNPEKLEIIGTGQQCRDFVHVSDVVNALVKVGTMNSVTGEVYNLGFGKTVSILELSKMMLTIMGLQDKTVVTTTNVSWHGDVTKIWFDVTKAKKELNWNPKVSLEDNIKEIIAERNLIR
ncbi:MAG: GDP-mannose 4,6-dehydratase [Nitrososphaerota archaeon]|jgi:UDP-glucose 4-epimerase|uniref:GDP-mannose 4,6-dehydratase n=1 Tax=Candidatus Bathycorpusculum sp. TaxID=2994959 RepID=UPI00281EDB45|nr:GDP-mannose 4,6-dehydratase [Candidatus Termiticorpusculum sp.]MCL2256612.1 GDP-mannose 4,6-dehydratase [Candidatus Termiticorpusculum sp.]MCL2293234.1 GDP-mannose 4,6-dehydratase [Candidatus Termiticorpusculum sp.]MDR0461075.1 GDP-mannose 4,6-dehydratase [Nitrososphaerota archaeon]